MTPRLLTPPCLLRCLSAFLGLSGTVHSEIVVNEIHYSPSPDNEAVEFVELYNAGTETVDLSGWQFVNGLAFTFPEGSALAPGGFYILAENEAQYNKKFGSIFAGGKKAHGQFDEGRLGDGGDTLVLENAAGEVMDQVSYQDRFPWPVAASGDGPSMELIHPGLDNDLGSSWRSSVAPTPGETNSVFAEEAPPQIRQVDHTPRAPLPGEEVSISAKVTDPDSVASVTLRYQLVEPGNYLSIDDPLFLTEWTELAMTDDGQTPDQTAGDDIYTITLPGDLQRHRHLMRYQITVEDAAGSSITVPYPDDGQPNFAYYCYGEMPAWTAAVEPGETEQVTFSPELLQSVPVYQLITTKENHVESQHIPGSSRGTGYTGDDYLWSGTLVYDGEIYDHIRFRARGGVWRYAMGKNMWKFLFNRGHEFQARNHLGEPYPRKWRRLNFSAMIQQGNFGHRGEQGMFEAVGFDLFRLAGVPAPQTHYLHFRIVENRNESNIFGNQYGTDFQGLYLAIEQIDGRFLDAHDLPDGNIYKMENNTGDPPSLDGELKNLAAYPAVSDSSDLQAFKNDGYERNNHSRDPEWWTANLHMEDYYSYRSIVEYIHHYDTGAGKNYYYYHDHQAGLWRILPWDLDLTWDDGMYSTSSPHRFSTTALAIDEFAIEYQNRLVELADLLFNEEQTGLLIDERASAIYTPGETSLVDADRMMWDYNPILSSRFVNPSKAAHGRFYRAASSRDFAGMLEKMKEYVPHRTEFAKNRFIEEGLMPKAPTVTYLGEDGYGVDDLSFASTEFKGGTIFAPQEFGALKWRLAEVTDVEAENFSPEPPNHYEIHAVWESEVITDFTPEIRLPTAVVRPGRLYRVRARMANTDGYWSHWSAPVQFIAGPPDIQRYLDGLVISEILHAPAEASADEIASGFVTADFEFIELLNVGSTALDLQDVRFTKGIDYDFSQASQQILEPGERLVLARNQAAFESRYADASRVVGSYAEGDGNKLDNGGERLKLSFGAGVAIRDFDFGQGEGWPEVEEGHSLNLLDSEQATDHALPGNWGVSSVPGGTPGEADGEITPGPDPSESGYLAWQKAHFSEAQREDASISGAMADPDVDGWVNLQEYAFQGHPFNADRRAPALLSTENEDGTLTLSYLRTQGLKDVAYQLQFSNNLENWTTAQPATEVTPVDPLTEKVSFSLERQAASYWRILTTLTN